MADEQKKDTERIPIDKISKMELVIKEQETLIKYFSEPSTTMKKLIEPSPAIMALHESVNSMLETQQELPRGGSINLLLPADPHYWSLFPR